MEDRAFDRKAGDGRNHACITVAWEVVIADWSGAEIAGRLLSVIGNRLAFFLLPVDPLRVLRDSPFQVSLRIPLGDCTVEMRKFCLGGFAIHGAKHRQRGPRLDRRSAA